MWQKFFEVTGGRMSANGGFQAVKINSLLPAPGPVAAHARITFYSV